MGFQLVERIDDFLAGKYKDKEWLLEFLNRTTLSLSAGCDTGLGHMLAKKLDAMGMHVFAGCLYPGGEGATTLTSECSDRLRVITVDVCNPTVVREAAERIKQELHGKGLWQNLKLFLT